MSDRSAPFLGLVPYTEFDADYFFGREREIDLIADNLNVIACRAVLIPHIQPSVRPRDTR